MGDSLLISTQSSAKPSITAVHIANKAIIANRDVMVKPEMCCLPYNADVVHSFGFKLNKKVKTRVHLVAHYCIRHSGGQPPADAESRILT